MRSLLRVLIVDDSPDDALLTVMELRRGGFRPEARRVDSLAQLQAALAEQWDVVICDSRLPLMTAAEALSLTRSRLQRLPFILVTGLETEIAALRPSRSAPTRMCRRTIWRSCSRSCRGFSEEASGETEGGLPIPDFDSSSTRTGLKAE